jgi:hypothetical protein
MSPLLAAAQAHFVEREMKQIEAPQAAPEPDPEPDPSPPLPDVIVLPDQSVASSKPTPQEPVAPLPSVQKAEAFKPAQTDSVAEVQTPPPPPPRPPYSGIPFEGAGYMALRDRERREQAERDQERARLQEEARKQGRPGGLSRLTRGKAPRLSASLEFPVVWEFAVVENLREKERCKSSRLTPPRPRPLPTRRRRFCVAGERAGRMKSDLRESQYNGTPRDPRNGPGSLGMMTIVVTNLGTDINNPAASSGSCSGMPGSPPWTMAR